MNQHRESQATLPSTEHPLSEEPQLETNTSVHNNMLSNQEVQESYITQSHEDMHVQPLMTKSQRLCETEKQQNRQNQPEGREKSKSQGQPSRQFRKKIEGNSQHNHYQQQDIEHPKEGIYQASWGQQNLLESQEPNALQSRTDHPFSQASEYLLNLNYPRQEQNFERISENMEIQEKKVGVITSNQNFSNQNQLRQMKPAPIFQKITEIAQNPIQQQAKVEVDKKIQEKKVNPIQFINKQSFICSDSSEKIQNKNNFQHFEKQQNKVEMNMQIQERKKSPIDFAHSDQSKVVQPVFEAISVIVESPHKQFNNAQLLYQSQSSNRSAVYEVKITEKNDQNIDKLIKNNDIYGIQKKQHQEERQPRNYENKEVQTRTQSFDIQEEGSKKVHHRLSTEERDKRAVLGGYYDASENSSAKKRYSSKQKKEEEKTTSENQQGSNLETKPTLYQSERIPNEPSELKQFKLSPQPQQREQNKHNELNKSPKRNKPQESNRPITLEKTDDFQETESMIVNPSINDGPRSIMKYKKKRQISQHQSAIPVRRSKINSDFTSHPANKTVQSKPNTRRRGVKVSNPSSEFEKKETKKVFRNEQTRQRYLREMKKLGHHITQEETIVFEEDLGSAYTYLQMKNQANQTFLKPIRVSHRIFNKQQSRASASKSRRRSSKIKKEVKISQSPPLSLSPPRHASNSKTKNFKKHSVRKTNQKIGDDQDFLNVSYIKKHFRQFNFDEVKPDKMLYTPLTREDQLITDLINDYRHLEEEERQLKEDYEREMEENTIPGEPFQATITSMRIVESQQEIAERKKKLISQIQMYYQSPIEVQRVVDPNINNHGLYALLELSKKSAFIFRARYFVTQISNFSYALRKQIDEDLETIKGLVQQEEKDNIGVISPDEKILKLVKEAEEKWKKERAEKK